MTIYDGLFLVAEGREPEEVIGLITKHEEPLAELGALMGVLAVQRFLPDKAQVRMSKFINLVHKKILGSK
jgi:hypothetical protein